MTGSYQAQHYFGPLSKVPTAVELEICHSWGTYKIGRRVTPTFAPHIST